MLSQCLYVTKKARATNLTKEIHMKKKDKMPKKDEKKPMKKGKY